VNEVKGHDRAVKGVLSHIDIPYSIQLECYCSKRWPQQCAAPAYRLARPTRTRGPDPNKLLIQILHAVVATIVYCDLLTCDR
jgi:hypothetical protein